MVAIRIRPSIILLGDSLTQFGFGQDGNVGWSQLLAQTYARRADVFNRGYQGYDSRMIINEVLPSLFHDGEVDSSSNENSVLFWTIYLGANDAALPSGRDPVPLEEFRHNLHTIITTIREKTNGAPSTCSQNNDDSKLQEDTNSEVCFSRKSKETPIILLTPPPCDIELWRQLDPDDPSVPENGNEIYKTYGDTVKDVAKQHANISLIDTWKLLGGYDISGKRYQTDGVHLTGKGNRVIFDGVMEVIRQDYPHLAPMTDGNGKFGQQGIPLEGKLWWMYE